MKPDLSADMVILSNRLPGDRTYQDLIDATVEMARKLAITITLVIIPDLRLTVTPESDPKVVGEEFERLAMQAFRE